MTVGEGILALVRSEYGNLESFREVDQLLPRVGILRSRPGDQHRLFRRVNAVDDLLDRFRIGIGSYHWIRIDHGNLRVFFEHVARQRHHDRPRPAAARDVKRPRHDARNLPGVVNLDDPFGYGAEKMRVVDLLARFPPARRPTDLSDEQHQRHRIVFCAVHGDTCVGRARTAGNETDTRHARRLGVAFRHKTGAAFLAIGNQANFRRAVESVQNRDITFTRHAEDMPYTLVAETLSHCVTGNHNLSFPQFYE